MGALLPRNVPRTLGCAAVAFPLVACTTEDAVQWEAFNPDGEFVTVYVADGPTPEDLGTGMALLTRATNGDPVGIGMVTPFVLRAPEREVVVDVLLVENVATVVGRVSVDVAPGGGGAVESYELDRSARAVGAWTTELALAGGDGAPRSDTFSFRLWTAAED